jgi:hypothetical protein
MAEMTASILRIAADAINGLRTSRFHCMTKTRIYYQTLVSDADSSGLDDWGRNRPSRPHTFSNGP